jgi:hypothetical protein
MKTKLHFLATFLFASIAGFSQSQEGKNIGKINLSALAFKSINVQYERQVSHRTTIALGYATIPKSGLAFKGQINKQINNPNINIDAFQLGTSVITPEVRYYFGSKGAFHGFYLAPYARFTNYNIEGPISYTTSTKQTRTAVFDGRINMASGGLMMGSNIKLSERLYLDWWIAGASFGSAKGDIHAETKLTPDEQVGLKNTLDRVDIPFTTVESEVNGNGATIRSSGNVVGVRGFGVNLGFRF